MSVLVRHYLQTDGQSSNLAEAYPSINAVRLRGFIPLVGDDLTSVIASPLRQDSRLKQLHPYEVYPLLYHELLHVALGESSVDRMLRDLVHAIYLLLFSLDETATLHIPSWHIEGNARLALLAPKLPSLISELDPEACSVDEAICHAMSVVVRRISRRSIDPSFMCSVDHLDDRELREFRVAIGDELREANEVMGSMYDALVEEPWFDTPGEEGKVASLLSTIGRHALGVPVSTLSRWWKAGHATDLPSQGPCARFWQFMSHLKKSGARDIHQALAELRKTRLLVGRRRTAVRFGGSPRVLMNAPNPLLEVASALEIDIRTWNSTHPIGKALAYLFLGFDQPVAREAEGRRPVESLSPLRTYHAGTRVVMPVLSDNDRQGGACCRHELHLPIPISLPAMSDVIENGLPAGKHPDALRTRFTIMPASAEAKLLWDLDQIAGMLLSPVTPTTCTGCLTLADSSCSLRQLATRVYSRIRTDNGGPLPAPPCMSQAWYLGSHQELSKEGGG